MIKNLLLKIRYILLFKIVLKYLNLKADIVYVARCAELSSLSAHGKTQEQALREIKMVVLEALKWMEEDGEKVPEPFSLHCRVFL